MPDSAFDNGGGYTNINDHMPPPPPPPPHNQVKKITSDIKQMDNAKKHLTDSIRTLERLRFLIANLEDLQ